MHRESALGLVGSWGAGTGPTLVLNGHIDVVPPGDLAQWRDRAAYAGVTRDGAVYGRGACDMKGGLVCSLFAIQAVRAAGIRLRGRVLLESVVGEEDGGLGTFATLQRGYRGDAAIIAEPTDLAIIRDAARGRLAEQRARSARRGGTHRRRARRDHRRCAPRSRGGDRRRVRRRPVAPRAPRGRGLVRRPVRERPDPRRPPLVDLVSGAHATLAGVAPDIHGAPYGSDPRLMVGLGGIPTLHYGPGNVKHAHSPDEHVPVAHLRSVVRTMVLSILRFCGHD